MRQFSELKPSLSFLYVFKVRRLLLLLLLLLPLVRALTARPQNESTQLPLCPVCVCGWDNELRLPPPPLCLLPPPNRLDIQRRHAMQTAADGSSSSSSDWWLWLCSVLCGLERGWSEWCTHERICPADAWTYLVDKLLVPIQYTHLQYNTFKSNRTAKSLS